MRAWPRRSPVALSFRPPARTGAERPAPRRGSFRRRCATGPLLVLAAGVAALLLLSLLRDVVRLRRVKCGAVPVASALVRASRPRTARIATSDRVVTPTAVGYVHPAVILPRDFRERVDDAEWDAVLAHECAHLARRDDWAKALQSAFSRAGVVVAGTLDAGPRARPRARARERRARRRSCRAAPLRGLPAAPGDPSRRRRRRGRLRRAPLARGDPRRAPRPADERGTAAGARRGAGRLHGGRHRQPGRRRAQRSRPRTRVRPRPPARRGAAAPRLVGQCGVVGPHDVSAAAARRDFHAGEERPIAAAAVVPAGDGDAPGGVRAGDGDAVGRRAPADGAGPGRPRFGQRRAVRPRGNDPASRPSPAFRARGGGTSPEGGGAQARLRRRAGPVSRHRASPTIAGPAAARPRRCRAPRPRRRSHRRIRRQPGSGRAASSGSPCRPRRARKRAVFRRTPSWGGTLY